MRDVIHIMYKCFVTSDKLTGAVAILFTCKVCSFFMYLQNVMIIIMCSYKCFVILKL